ncbi:MAG: hypothetical protein QW802_00540 [Candidatus Altiarchaeota archaeon]
MKKLIFFIGMILIFSTLPVVAECPTESEYESYIIDGIKDLRGLRKMNLTAAEINDIVKYYITKDLSTATCEENGAESGVKIKYILYKIMPCDRLLAIGGAKACEYDANKNKKLDDPEMQAALDDWKKYKIPDDILYVLLDIWIKGCTLPCVTSLASPQQLYINSCSEQCILKGYKSYSCSIIPCFLFGRTSIGQYNCGFLQSCCCW